MVKKFQTISEFLQNPFHTSSDVNKDTTYNSKYVSFSANNKIRLVAICVIEGSYYYHVRIPSESQKNENYEYDVVIRFFTDKPEIESEGNLQNYFVQFFSNSPSFMYQYAYLYNKEGFLIEALYKKTDTDYINTPPSKTNPSLVKSYDKSIYFACRFLSDKNFALLNKKGTTITLKTVNQTKFFNDISDFKSVRLDQAIIQEERKLKSVRKDKSPRKYSDTSNGKKSATNTTVKQGDNRGVTVANKITGKKKITAKRSTRKM